jgi:hypothetical protein
MGAERLVGKVALSIHSPERQRRLRSWFALFIGLLSIPSLNYSPGTNGIPHRVRLITRVSDR